MVDSVAKRMTDNQIRMAVDDLIRDSDRLADDARRYADSLKTGTIANSGMASRLAQDVADLARRASRLDGMRDIAALITEED